MRNRKFLVGTLAALLVLAGCPSNTAFTLAAVTPGTIAAGAETLRLTLVGTGFTAPLTAVWNSTPLATTLINSTEATATVPAGLMAAPGEVHLFALQGTAPNQTATASLTITIAPALVAPTITALSPAHVIAGTPTVKITVTGTGFTPTSTVNYDGTAVAAAYATYVSPTQLSFTVGGGSIASAGTGTVTVTNSAGTSAAATLTVVPVLTVTTASLPGGTVGMAYSATLAAAGGVSPYSWAITTGNLPAGLTLAAATGIISGTPTGAGSATFTVTCTDATGTLALKRF